MRSQTIRLCLFTSLLLLNCTAKNDHSTAIKSAVKDELQRYPQATLLDLYKFFFQGAFGPGHLIPDAEAARRYLEEELRTSTSFDTVRWQPVGHQGKYYRLNLSLVHEGGISPQTLLTAFVESANAASPPSLEEWRKEWQMILAVVEGMQLNLADFANDKLELEKNLAGGKVIGHHSAAFEKSYHPHYRVVDKKHFEALLRERE